MIEWRIKLVGGPHEHVMGAFCQMHEHLLGDHPAFSAFGQPQALTVSAKFRFDAAPTIIVQVDESFWREVMKGGDKHAIGPGVWRMFFGRSDDELAGFPRIPVG